MALKMTGVLLVLGSALSLSAQDVSFLTPEKERRFLRELREQQAEALRLAEGLEGYATLRQSFLIDDDWALVGPINGFPPSLRIVLRRTDDALIDSVWWFNPVDRAGKPTADWDDFLAAYNDASRIAGRHAWLRAWQGASSGRRIELHLFGKEIGESLSTLNTFVLPPWRDAGFAGTPAYHLLLRRDARSWAALYLDAEGENAMVGYTTDPDVSERPLHWLDAVDVGYHPTCRWASDRSARYVTVTPSGDWELRSVSACARRGDN